ncbi:hypothetical protein ACLOJK_014017 [Asimina triloba]
MNSLDRCGGKLADSFLGVEGECLDVGGNDGAAGLGSGPEESSLLLTNRGNGADGFCTNAGSENDERPSTVGECCNQIDDENVVSGSAGCNTCVNVAEMSWASMGSIGKSGDDLNRCSRLDGACQNNNEVLVVVRNGNEDNVFELDNKDCTRQDCNDSDNVSLGNANCDRMDGLDRFHCAAASDDGGELPTTRRGTEDGYRVSGPCLKESGDNSGQDELCINFASADDEEPSASVRKELIDDSENPLGTGSGICSSVAPLDDEKPDVVVRTESGEGCETSSGTDCPVIDDNRQIDCNGDGGQSVLCSKVVPLADEKPLVTMRKDVEDRCDNSLEMAYPLVDGSRENDDEKLSVTVKNDVEVIFITTSEVAQPKMHGDGENGKIDLCFKDASVENEEPLAVSKNDSEDGHVNPSETALPLMDGNGESDDNGEGGQNGLCLSVAFGEGERVSLTVRLEDECGTSGVCSNGNAGENSLGNSFQCVSETADCLVDDDGLTRQHGLGPNVGSVNISEPLVVGGNVGVDDFGVKKLCSGDRDDLDHWENTLVSARPLINGGLHLDVASKNSGEPSSSGGNDTMEESRHSPHEYDMETQRCISNMWDGHENISESIYPLMNRCGGSDDVADASRSDVCSENEVEPSICMNEDDDAQRGGAIFNKGSDWKTELCTSQLSHGHGDTMGASSTLTDNNSDGMEGQNENGLGENNRDALIFGGNGIEDRGGFGRLHPDESNKDTQSCCLLQANSCEDVLEMTCSLNSAADFLDSLPDELQLKDASHDYSEPWIIEKEGNVVYGVCSSSSESDAAYQLSIGSMNDGPYPDRERTLNMLKVPSHSEEMSPSSLVTKSQKMENCVSGSLEETVSSSREVEQEASLIEACISTGLAAHTSFPGGNSIEGSPPKVFHCSLQELASTHSKCSTNLGYAERDAAVSAVVFSEYAHNVAKFSSQLDHVFRNNSSCKSSRSSRTRKAARQCQQAANNIGVFLNNARRKRSYSGEQKRSSLWGSMGNIMQLFKHSAEILKFDSQLTKMQKQGSKNSKSVSGRRRHQKTNNRGNSRGSKAKVRAAAKRAQLKVMKEEGGERSLESVPSEVVDSSASILTVNGCSPESDCCVGLEIPKSAGEVECKFEGDGCHVKGFLFADQNLEKLENHLNISTQDAHSGDKDIDSTLTREMSIENPSGHYPGASPRDLAEASGEAVENMDPYPQITPINSLPTTSVVGISSSEGAVYTRRKTSSKSRIKAQNGFVADPTVPSHLDDAVSTPRDAFIALVNVMPPKMNCPSTNEVIASGEVKEGQPELAGCSSFEKKLFGPAKLNKARKSSRRRPTLKVAGVFEPVGDCRITSGKASTPTSNGGIFTMKSLVSDATEGESWKETLKVDSGLGTNECFGQDVGISHSEPCKSELLNGAKIKEHKPTKSSTDASRKYRSRVTDSAKHGRGNARGEKKNSKKKEKCSGLSGNVAYKDEMHAVADAAESEEIHEDGNDIFSNLGRNSNTDTVVSEGIVNSIKLPLCNDKALTKSCNAFEVQCLPTRVAWVRCDDCFKWRCISAALADEIEETNRKWTCKDNLDKAFADCLIPQEKTNAEINAELEISDASCEEDSCSAYPLSRGSERKQLGASQQATWTLIKSNIFLHRSCKTQTIDEVMVCQCKPSFDGSLGCSDECLNRMLNIECVKGTCPCGDLCSNQQFQKRKYTKFKWIRCGKKGYGLQLQENVSKGAFLIEYVGEVLDLHTYEARQREYAARCQKHFYFMTLNGSEVIDACAKGNLGRFINHSCDPNCRTEKVEPSVLLMWQGEEVTFDYNYVRVFGAAAKKCVCGSSECRGYIGGDPQSTEIIVQEDSDDEYPEPVMVCDDGNGDHNLDEMIPCASSLDVAYKRHAEISSGMIDFSGKSLPTIQLLEDLSQKQDSMKKFSPHSQQSEALQIKVVTIKSSPLKHFGDSLREEDSTSELLASAPKSQNIFETEESKSKSLSSVQPHDISSEIANGVPLAVAVEDKSIPAVGAFEKKSDLSKCPISRSSRSSGTIKKSKCNADLVMTNKPKRLADGTGRSHFDGVEQKLNELLDAEGGINKRKDSTKGYLKLLFVTAASGDHTEASHSLYKIKVGPDVEIDIIQLAQHAGSLLGS